MQPFTLHRHPVILAPVTFIDVHGSARRGKFPASKEGPVFLVAGFARAEMVEAHCCSTKIAVMFMFQGKTLGSRIHISDAVFPKLLTFSLEKSIQGIMIKWNCATTIQTCAVYFWDLLFCSGVPRDLKGFFNR